MKDDTFYYLKGPNISTRLKTRSNIPDIDLEDSTGVFLEPWGFLINKTCSCHPNMDLPFALPVPLSNADQRSIGVC